MITYLQKFAKDRSLECKQDSTGNMVIKRPGSGGGEKAPTVVIQVQLVIHTMKTQHSHMSFLLLEFCESTSDGKGLTGQQVP